MAENVLVLRVDANAQIGSGHLIRCLALAQAWQLEGGHAIILSHCESDALRQHSTDAGIEFMQIADAHPDSRDLYTTLEVLRMRSAGTIENPTWLVLDGYHFDPVYQQAVRTAGYRLLVIDDMAHLPVYHADILLNQNLGAEKLKYNHDPDTTLLLGSWYALLRQEFLAWRGWQREIPDVAHKVLVTMGGGDPDNVTLKVIHALEQVRLDGLEAVVVVGGNNPHYEILQSAIRNLQPKICLERNASNMPELMAWADVAVAGGGSTCWELAFMGLPNIIMTLAKNQEGVARGLGMAGVSINLGNHGTIGPAEIVYNLDILAKSSLDRTEMSKHGNMLVNGLGSDRVVRWMQVKKLSIRLAEIKDCRIVWEWANNPLTRAVSFSQDSIPWEQHQTWFIRKISDPQTVFFIALDTDLIPIGQVRYQMEDQEAVVSIGLAANMRGMGYGSQILELASKQMFETRSVRLIHAYIKPDNIASQRAFEKAKFINKGVVSIQGNQVFDYILTI